MKDYKIILILALMIFNLVGCATNKTELVAKYSHHHHDEISNSACEFSYAHKIAHKEIYKEELSQNEIELVQGNISYIFSSKLAYNRMKDMLNRPVSIPSKSRFINRRLGIIGK